MKKLIVLAVVALVPMIIMGAAPEMITEWAAHDTITIDSQYSNGGFEVVDSVILTMTDTCNVVFTVSGTVSLEPGQRLYLAMGNDSANVLSASNTKADTSMGSTYIKYFQTSRGEIRVDFVKTWRDSLRSQTDRTDTFYINAACGGSATADKIFIEDLLFQADVRDAN